MEKVSKRPQEIAAQMMDVYPYYSEFAMPEDEAARLGKQARAIRAEVESIKPYTLTDEQLVSRLTAIQNKAADSGVWHADKGDGADERFEYAVREQKKWGYSDQEAKAAAHKKLRSSGYLDAIRLKRKEQEQAFREPINVYINDHKIDAATEKTEINGLLQSTVDIATISRAEQAMLAMSFPTGNFLYHGTGTERLVHILDSGLLANTKALKEREAAVAAAEGREIETVQHNSGYEGISWSMNGIDALPGDRYHLAGFLAAPEMVLGEGNQLAVPSLPSPNEVVLIDDKIDVAAYYTAKTQLELYESSERNSVLGGLLDIVSGDSDDQTVNLVDLLPDLQNDALVKKLRDNYTVTEKGVIVLSPDLLASTDADTELPVAAVWLQGLADTGRLEGTDFEGMNTAEVILNISDQNIKQLYTELHKDAEAYEDIFSGEVGAAAVPVENMYFVAARKDADAWLKVLARSPHKPAGMLLYDDKKVQLENFASLHRGDHKELTAELQSVIDPTAKGYIDYNEVLGAEFGDDMRTGHKHQVIAERHLANRGAIKKVNDKLVIER